MILSRRWNSWTWWEWQACTSLLLDSRWWEGYGGFTRKEINPSGDRVGECRHRYGFLKCWRHFLQRTGHLARIWTALSGSSSRWFKTATFEGSFWAILAEFGRSRTKEIARFFRTWGGRYFVMISKEKAQATILMMQSFHNYAKMGSKIDVFLPFFEFRWLAASVRGSYFNQV